MHLLTFTKTLSLCYDNVISLGHYFQNNLSWPPFPFICVDCEWRGNMGILPQVGMGHMHDISHFSGTEIFLLVLQGHDWEISVSYNTMSF
jgi:hypothetical protein